MNGLLVHVKAFQTNPLFTHSYSNTINHAWITLLLRGLFAFKLCFATHFAFF